jgi:hypothetical protein
MAVHGKNMHYEYKKKFNTITVNVCEEICEERGTHTIGFFVTCYLCRRKCGSFNFDNSVFIHRNHEEQTVVYQLW